MVTLANFPTRGRDCGRRVTGSRPPGERTRPHSPPPDILISALRAPLPLTHACQARPVFRWVRRLELSNPALPMYAKMYYCFKLPPILLGNRGGKAIFAVENFSHESSRQPGKQFSSNHPTPPHEPRMPSPLDPDARHRCRTDYFLMQGATSANLRRRSPNHPRQPTSFLPLSEPLFGPSCAPTVKSNFFGASLNPERRGWRS